MKNESCELGFNVDDTKEIMQCQSKEEDAILEKEVRDVVSIVESLDFQHSTQHVKDSACSMRLNIFIGVNLEV